MTEEFITLKDKRRLGFAKYRSSTLPDDLLELVDVLGLERFAVIGASQGGPYPALLPTRSLIA